MCLYLFSFATLKEKKMEVATWGHLKIICESCNNLTGVSKENYPLEMEILTTLNFQTRFHICTKLLDKYFEQKPSICKC
jgi:hypothetical protein